ncbi:MAG TPA: hypothetical protein VE476_08970 [Propionibacteriaceae bacterium]|nr:hypothetical protein [Propionibacteriaceae bacterium]
MEEGDEELAGGRSQLVWLGRHPRPGVEPLREPPVQLGDVRPDAGPRVGVGRVDRLDRHAGRGEQPLDVLHRGHQPVLLPTVEWREQ